LRAGEKNPDNQTARRDSGMQSPAAKPAVTPPSASPAEDKDVRDRLDWYGSVNKPGESGVKGLEPTKGASPAPLLLPARKPETTPSAVTGRTSSKVEPESKPPRTAQPAAISYSVQVGAFRQRKEAEAKAAVLQSKKYACVIEPSGGPDGLYLLKVGKYESRADAIAMQNRLKKDGFTTFIKTNK
jgi:cell division protein FtsN